MRPRRPRSGGIMKIRDVEAFQVSWSPDDTPHKRSAFVRIHTDDGHNGIGEASPMQGGLASLGIVARDIAPMLIGQDPLDHAVLLDTAFHRFAKLGPEGALTGALAALDIALWDLKGKFLGQPIYKLLGGAWHTSLPFYASIGGNGERSVDQVLRVVEGRLKDNPAAVKIRFDNDRTRLDLDIAGDIAKAKAVRKLVGDGFELVPHQTQPTIGHMASLHVAASQLHMSKPCEWNDPSSRTHAVFDNPPTPIDGLFHLPAAPGLGLTVNEAELAKRRVALA